MLTSEIRTVETAVYLLDIGLFGRWFPVFR